MSYLHPQSLMEESCLLQESQAEFPGDRTIATQSDEGTCLDVGDTVVGLPASPWLIRDLTDGGGRGRNAPMMLWGGHCWTGSRLLTLQEENCYTTLYTVLCRSLDSDRQRSISNWPMREEYCMITWLFSSLIGQSPIWMNKHTVKWPAKVVHVSNLQRLSLSFSQHMK